MLNSNLGNISRYVLNECFDLFELTIHPAYRYYNFQELKEKLEVEKEKNERINLADAAAQNSAQILEQTQASTHIGAGLLVITHVVYLIIGVFSIIASGLMDIYDRVES